MKKAVFTGWDVTLLFATGLLYGVGSGWNMGNWIQDDTTSPRIFMILGFVVSIIWLVQCFLRLKKQKANGK